MGFVCEFNWILKLSNIDESEMVVSHTYPFKKSEVRVFPIGLPIDLVNKNWEAVASCVINEITMTAETTTGTYTILEIYDSKKPQLPKGAIAQAWSVGEVLRIILEK